MSSYSSKEIWRGGYEKLSERFSKHLPISDKSILLELGCGKGGLTIPISRRVKGKIIALDGSEYRLDVLRKKLSRHKLEQRVQTVVQEASEFLIQTRGFDAIFSNFFLGWLEIEKGTLIFSRIYDSLKEGGIMIHSDFDPNINSPAQSIAIDQGSEGNNLDPSPKWWTPDEILHLAKSQGFQETLLEIIKWDVDLPFEAAVKQLQRWGAKPEFIRENEETLRSDGMRFPNSYIIYAKKGK